jgi:hypothetical protein
MGWSLGDGRRDGGHACTRPMHAPCTHACTPCVGLAWHARTARTAHGTHPFPLRACMAHTGTGMLQGGHTVAGRQHATTCAWRMAAPLPARHGRLTHTCSNNRICCRGLQACRRPAADDRLRFGARCRTGGACVQGARSARVGKRRTAPSSAQQRHWGSLWFHTAHFWSMVQPGCILRIIIMMRRLL